jgi:hypothetical protein
MNFTFVVTISTSSQEQAERVMAERIDHDEDYGFEYTIAYVQDDTTATEKG